MKVHRQRDQLHVAAQFQTIFRELGLDAEAIFSHPLIKPWRTLPDRENCTLDATTSDGRIIRFHVKRYASKRSSPNPADLELTGRRLLVERAIPTVDLVAWGKLGDGRSFVILDDLAGYQAADKLLRGALPFQRLLEPTAHLAARLHEAGLHHRDLYLCHFFAKVGPHSVDLRLIDTARVRPLPRLLGQRWIVKDLAQFWYSTTSLPIDDRQRSLWLDIYAKHRHIERSDALRRRVQRKAAWIARHDVRLRSAQPTRNVSIPRSS